MIESTPTLAALAQRVTVLERSNRRLKAILCASLLAAAGLANLAMAGDDTIKTRMLHLLDDAGKPRVLLSVRTGISMLDENNHVRVVLNVDREGPGLALYGGTSQVGMIANVNSDGPALTMRDNQGRTRAMLAAANQGPALILWDGNDRESAALINGAKGSSLTLADSSGSTAWRAP